MNWRDTGADRNSDQVRDLNSDISQTSKMLSEMHLRCESNCFVHVSLHTVQLETRGMSPLDTTDQNDNIVSSL